MAHRLLVNTLPIKKPASPSGIFWRDTRTPVRRSSQAWPTRLLADSLITPKPRSSSLSYTRFWVKCTLGSFPWTAQILSQLARFWKLSARSKLSPLVQKIRVYCCFLYAVSDWIFDSSSPSQWTSSKSNDGWKWRTSYLSQDFTYQGIEDTSTLYLIWFSFGGWIQC